MISVIYLVNAAREEAIRTRQTSVQPEDLLAAALLCGARATRIAAHYGVILKTYRAARRIALESALTAVRAGKPLSQLENNLLDFSQYPQLEFSERANRSLKQLNGSRVDIDCALVVAVASPGSVCYEQLASITSEVDQMLAELRTVRVAESTLMSKV